MSTFSPNPPPATRQGRYNLYALVFVAALIGVVVALNAPLGESAQPQDVNAVPAPRVGSPAPDITFSYLNNGQPGHLIDYRGKAIILNFWATWCPPCRAEMPDLQAVYDSYKDRGLVILAMDAFLTEGNGLSGVQGFVSQYGLTFPVGVDTTGTVSQIYRVYSLPTSVFIDRQGIIRDIVPGGMSRPVILERLKKIL